MEILNFVNEEIIKDVDLPGLTVEDIEAVLSENADWSGEQIEQFLRSAVDLSEIEAKLFSATGYESDSGYSTYDVSPVTSTAPLHLPPGGTFQSRSLSPALTPVDPTPFFRCNYSPTNPSFPPTSPHMIHPSLHDSITSPINDASIFSPPRFTAFGPNQDTRATTYLPTSMFAPFPLSHPPQSLPYSTQDYCSPSLLNAGAYFSENPATSTMEGISSPFTELLAPESPFTDDVKPTHLRSNPLTCESATDGLIHYENFMSSGSQELVVNRGGLLETHSLSNLKHNHEPATLNMPESLGTVVKSEPDKQVSCSVSDSMEAHTSSSEGEPTTTISSIKTETTVTSASGPTQMQTTLAPSLQNLPNIPGINTQLLQSLCSQMPMLSKLLASSSNPAIFLVAITTALSTLTKPFQDDGATSVNVNGLPGIKSELSKLPPTEVEQLKSRIAKLGADQIEKLLSLKTDGTPSSNPAAPAESNLRSCSQAVPVQGKKPTERTVFARILPTQSSVCPPPTASVPVSSSHGLQNNSWQVGVNPHSKNSVAQYRYPIQDSESVGAKQNLKGQRARLHKAGNPVAMKPSHKKSKTSQWPRSMNKANLMAFREHILSKLKKGQEEMTYSSSEANAIATSITPKVETPSPSSEYRAEVMCERNHTTVEGFCDSKSTELLDSMSKSPMSLDHCENGANDTTARGRSLEFSDLLFQDDIFSDFHFNPDTLLSSSSLSMDAGVLDMIGGIESENELNCGGLAHSDLSEELAQILCSDDSPHRVPTPSEQESMEIDCIREFLSETHNDCKPVPPPNQTHLHVNLQRPCSNASATGSAHYSNRAQEYKQSVLTDSDRIAIQTSEALRQCVVNATTYSFPEPNTAHGSLGNFTSEAPLKFHCLDSILQTQRDPLLADGTCNVTEHFDI